MVPGFLCDFSVIEGDVHEVFLFVFDKLLACIKWVLSVTDNLVA